MSLWAAAAPMKFDMFARYGAEMENYERLGETARIRESVEKLLSEPPEDPKMGGMSRGAWEAWPNRCLLLAFEYADVDQKERLLDRFSQYEGLMALAQFKGVRSARQDAPWTNLPEGSPVIAFDESTYEALLWDQRLVIRQPWGLRIFDLQGKLEQNILIPGETRDAEVVGDDLYVSSSEGTYHLASDGTTSRLGPSSRRLVKHEGSLWFADLSKAYRYRPNLELMEIFELGTLWSMELENDRLLALGYENLWTWDKASNTFQGRAAWRPTYGRPPSDKTKHDLGNGLQLDGAKLFTANNGGEIRFLDTYWIDYDQLIVDGESLWVRTGLNTLRWIRGEEEFTFPLPVDFKGGGATEDRSSLGSHARHRQRASFEVCG